VGGAKSSHTVTVVTYYTRKWPEFEQQIGAAFAATSPTHFTTQQRGVERHSRSGTPVVQYACPPARPMSHKLGCCQCPRCNQLLFSTNIATSSLHFISSSGEHAVAILHTLLDTADGSQASLITTFTESRTRVARTVAAIQDRKYADMAYDVS
jgi:hypothetical protein